MEKKSNHFVDLDIHTHKMLEDQAKKKSISLENHMEDILVKKANDLELSDAYKKEVDAFWERENKGQNIYVSAKEFRK